MGYGDSRSRGYRLLTVGGGSSNRWVGLTEVDGVCFLEQVLEHSARLHLKVRQIAYIVVQLSD